VAFVVNSDNVEKNEEGKFQETDNELVITYDWWSELGVPVIRLDNVYNEILTMNWEKSFFVIKGDTLPFFVTKSDLRRFTGSVYPPTTIPKDYIYPDEFIEIEGYPFLDYKRIEARGENFILPKVHSPAVQEIVIQYEIANKMVEVRHEFYINAVYKLSNRRFREMRNNKSIPYDHFYRDPRNKEPSFWTYLAIAALDTI
jgi:hypothetical protein